MKLDGRKARGLAMLSTAIGKRYYRLVAIGIGEKNKFGRNQIVSICDCGNIVHSDRCKLEIGKIKSCGCYNRDRWSSAAFKHGQCYTEEYKTWSRMKTRCFNKNRADYKLYGERGIAVHPSWLSFETFLKDMGPKPSRIHTIERINNSKGYSAGNCKWATQSDQQNNKRTNRFIRFNGKTLTLAQWGRETGLGKGTITYRLKRGWTVMKALTTEAR